MRHRYFGTKLGRNTKERHALFTGLTKSLLLHGAIETTEAKAKAVTPKVEKLVHAVCRYTELNAKRELRRLFSDRSLVARVYQSLIDNIGEKTARVTRFTRIKVRQGDDALIVKLSFIKPYTLKELAKPEVPSKETAPKKAPVKKTVKKVAKK